MMLDQQQVETALAGLALGEIVAMTELSGGHAAVFKLDLSDGRAVTLKVYQADHTKPDKDAFAAAQLR
ncbi:hypothetical protein N8D56_06535 [Devosia sp. A8/3-2]|nr:hypothetical protein N8D56_06535 [Devosia sp. A8/3-2]